MEILQKLLLLKIFFKFEFEFVNCERVLSAKDNNGSKS